MKEPQTKASQSMARTSYFDPIEFIKAYREINSDEKPKFKERKQKEAEAIAGFIRDYTESSHDNLATKGDVLDLRSEMGEMKSEMGEMKSEMGEIRSEIRDVRNEIKLVEHRMTTKMIVIMTGLLTLFSIGGEFFRMFT